MLTTETFLQLACVESNSMYEQLEWITDILSNLTKLNLVKIIDHFKAI